MNLPEEPWTLGALRLDHTSRDFLVHLTAKSERKFDGFLGQTRKVPGFHINKGDKWRWANPKESGRWVRGKLPWLDQTQRYTVPKIASWVSTNCRRNMKESQQCLAMSRLLCQEFLAKWTEQVRLHKHVKPRPRMAIMAYDPPGGGGFLPLVAPSFSWLPCQRPYRLEPGTWFRQEIRFPFDWARHCWAPQSTQRNRRFLSRNRRKTREKFLTGKSFARELFRTGLSWR